MLHWTLDHLPNVSSVIIIVRSILCFQYVGHSTHTYLRATPMALSSPPFNLLSRAQYKPHTFYYPTPSVPDHRLPCSDHQRRPRNWKTSSSPLHPASLWFSATKTNLRPYRVTERGRLNWRLILGRVIGSKLSKLEMLLIFGADRLVNDFNMSCWSGCNNLLWYAIHISLLSCRPQPVYYALKHAGRLLGRVVIQSCSLTIYMNRWQYSHPYPVQLCLTSAV